MGRRQGGQLEPREVDVLGGQGNRTVRRPGVDTGGWSARGQGLKTVNEERADPGRGGPEKEACSSARIPTTPTKTPERKERIHKHAQSKQR